MSAPQQTLSSADTAWLHMDRASNLMVINAVLMFDEQLDWQRLGEVVRTRLVERYPRFRERVAESLLRGARWEQDPDFELARHMHRRGLAAPGDERALQELAGDLASIPLDRGKPLWEMYLIDGPAPGSAVIVRMHHCIADGIALAGVMLSLTDAGRGDAAATTDADPAAARTAAPLRRALSAAAQPPAQALGAARRTTGVVARETLRTLAHPRHALELGDGLAADVRALGKLLLTPPDSRGPLKRELGTGRAVAWSRPIALERVKKIAHAQDATVNDVMLAAVSGALRTHLISSGEEPREIRTLVPFNLRPLDPIARDQLGNRFGLVFLTLPVDRASRRERLHELKLRMDAIKGSPEGPVSYLVLEAVGLTPPELERRIVDLFTAKATAVMTNVPGPRETRFLAGAPLRAVLVWAPTAGSVGTSVSIFSYDGAITVGLLAHSALLPDPRSIVTRLERELNAMERLAPGRGPARAGGGRGT